VQRGKAKAKAKRQKHRARDRYAFEENYPVTSENIVERTTNRLNNLGKQVFALFPFSEHFDRWLTDVRVVMSEFESSPTISLDDQFEKERSTVLSSVELALDERRRREALAEEPIRRLSKDRALLEQLQKEHAATVKETEGRRNREAKRLSSGVEALREELGRINGLKTGIFRGLSQKAKAQMQAEATQKLKASESELASALKGFSAREEGLRNEYEKKTRPIIEQMQAEQKEIDEQMIDASFQARQAACEALAKAVNALVERRSSLVNQA
jgi:hypothetical protein